ncbi:MAG: membrane protein [Actinobacteria bacterium]|nr:membrane protein [Actinomycetota bacterium]
MRGLADRIARTRWVARYTYLMAGLFVAALGMEITVEGRVGVSPWNVLHLGLSNRIGLTLGQVMQGVGLLLVVLCAIAGIWPRIATVLNMIFVGYFVDLVAGWKLVEMPPGVLTGSLINALGQVLTGVGTAMYITADLGAGPRDTLMVVLTRRSGWPVGLIRSLIEATVLAAGYFLGGPVGIGTVLGVAIVGPSVQYSLKGFARVARWPVFRGVIQVPAVLRKSA